MGWMVQDAAWKRLSAMGCKLITVCCERCHHHCYEKWYRLRYVNRYYCEVLVCYHHWYEKWYRLRYVNCYCCEVVRYWYAITTAVIS